MMKTRNELAQQLFHGTGAELGVAAGAFSETILRESDCRCLYSIDRWNDHHNLMEYTVAVARLRLHGQRSMVWRMTFAEALTVVGSTEFDFLYLDGYAHTGQEGGQTLRDWWPKLRPGGIFAGHDYSPQFQPTIDAVDAFVAAHGLTLHLTTADKLPSWWIVKP